MGSFYTCAVNPIISIGYISWDSLGVFTHLGVWGKACMVSIIHARADRTG